MQNPLHQVTHDVSLLTHHNAKEYVILGRSNAGKSTLINRITATKIAKVSSSPGKTRTINLYQAHGKYWVDLPGAGYAKLSHSILKDLKYRIHQYVTTRKELSFVIHCMDIRNPWRPWDEALYELYSGIPVLWLLTKSDKLSRNQINIILKNLEKNNPGNYLSFGLNDKVDVLLSKLDDLDVN